MKHKRRNEQPRAAKIIGRMPDTAREGEARPKGSAGGTPAPPDYSSAELVEAENSPSGLQLSSRIGLPPNKEECASATR